MIAPKILDEMAERMSKIIPQGVREVQQDVQNNIRAALNSTFEKLNLVTREEFEVQSAVLARTRAKLKALDEKIAALEAELLKQRTEE
ncbi:MAG: accessory factor UbiK family protein [Gammaproteobacteria bacterium]|nr:accessory factor UbiK family protein [Gammaproteobacteria bacterium]